MEPKEAPSVDVEKKPEPEQGKPWSKLFNAQSMYFDNITCLKEMADIVAPILESKDHERKRRIDEITGKYKESKEETALEFSSYEQMKEFLDHVRKIRRADIMFHQGIITSIVARYDEFLAHIFRTAYSQNPGWLKSSDKKISYKEVLELDSLENFKNNLVEKEIDQLMRDSHLSQIEFLDSKLKIGISENFQNMKDFLEITERRNLFVHTGGVVSPTYLENCNKWAIPLSSKIKEGTRLGSGDKYFNKAYDCFYEISVRICQATARRLFSDCYEAADTFLNNKSVDLLMQNKNELAEKLFLFAINIPSNLKSKGDMPYYFIINLCIAEKRLGKNFKQRIDSIDWSPFHLKYHFAIAVLEDRYTDAVNLMRNQSVKEVLSELAFKEWPLLTDFIKSEIFLSAYREIYEKDFTEVMISEAKSEIVEQTHELVETNKCPESAATVHVPNPPLNPDPTCTA